MNLPYKFKVLSEQVPISPLKYVSKEVENNEKSTEEAEEESVAGDVQEKDSTSSEKTAVSQDTWGDAGTTDKTERNTSQVDNSSKDDKLNPEDKGNVNNNTKDESTDSEETTEPSLDVDGDNYFPLLP